MKEDKGEKKREEKKKIPLLIRILFSFLSGLFTFVSLIGKFLLGLYDILVPRSLRELVPILNMFRKYILVAAEILSGKKSKEVIEVANELEEIRMKEEMVQKAYPIRRGVGEVINLGLHPVIMFTIPTIIWGDDLYNLFVSWNIRPSLGILLFGTGLLCVSWIATIFGPIYAIFHQCSLVMLRRGNYRWAEIFQDLENIFALPYYTAKSSFSILDAPPISAETYQDFKLDIAEDVNQIKSRVQDLLALDSNQVPERSKRMLNKLCQKTQKTLGSLDIEDIKKETSRAFALLIWNKEGSMLPWKRNEALEEFAKRNSMDLKEAKKTLELIALKIKEGYTSEDLYFSIMLTGALKGIACQEEECEQYLSDIEYNSLALSLSLGAKQYLMDKFLPEPTSTTLLRKTADTIIAPFLPIAMVFYALFNYGKHIVVKTGKNITELRDAFKERVIISRYREINNTFYNSYKAVGKKRINFKEDLDIDFSNFFKKFGAFLLKVILLIPLLLQSLGKAIYRRFMKIWKKRSEEEKNKEKFEKEITTEALASMYQELYEKLILSNYSF